MKKRRVTCVRGKARLLLHSKSCWLMVFIIHRLLSPTEAEGLGTCDKFLTAACCLHALQFSILLAFTVQRPALGQFQGSVKSFLGSSTGWWADTTLLPGKKEIARGTTEKINTQP